MLDINEKSFFESCPLYDGGTGIHSIDYRYTVRPLWMRKGSFIAAVFSPWRRDS